MTKIKGPSSSKEGAPMIKCGNLRKKGSITKYVIVSSRIEYSLNGAAEMSIGEPTKM